ncbi:CalY family protein [Aquibacillus sp. 3ASR75-11]|uniref:CalY family protein n=1 Tax=Terrihalobacillus insolitus TaxID=2950438 RepID=A0A9X3WTL3_9BACI|nr:LPXTG cell wall anchor domain-containing protein [Terrihalobacillus insolitus]MDC3413625.1 CalY family protein [Terrihalobacillus insolitus]MDC3424618.1 CalY family protein [Terrihalobacillus insolitus]
MNRNFISFYCVIMLILIVFLPVGSIGAEGNTPEIDLITSPSNVVLDVRNMKPGDVTSRIITIKNGGNVDFNYMTKAEYTNGSKKLYDELLLQVTDNKGILYDGSLSGFTGLDARELFQSSEEQLTFNVEFPFESGNEFQGLATQFQLIFRVDTAPESGGGITPDGSTPTEDASGFGSVLPKTGEINPMIFYMTGLVIAVTGAVLYRERNALSLWLFNRRKGL